MNQTKVTVLMPVYNGEKYIRDAIKSILEQSWKDFEFLIINDGSTDASAEIIRNFSDSRIRLLSNEKNLGLIASLNRGLKEARGAYIARMDQDDKSLPLRLEKQVAFMDSHPNISACGTWIKAIGRHEGFVNKFLTSPEDIKANLLFYTSLAHPTVMLRKSHIDHYKLEYDSNNKYCEDYGLWVEISKTGLLANLPEVLLLYRIHGESLSHTYPDEQKGGASLLRKDQLKKLGLTPSDEEMRVHNSLRPIENESVPAFLNKEEKWLSNILESNVTSKVYDRASLDKVIYERWRTLCGMNSANLAVWRTFTSSMIFSRGESKKYIDSFKIVLKCFIKSFT